MGIINHSSNSLGMGLLQKKYEKIFTAQIATPGCMGCTDKLKDHLIKCKFIHSKHMSKL